MQSRGTFENFLYEISNLPSTFHKVELAFVRADKVAGRRVDNLFICIGDTVDFVRILGSFRGGRMWVPSFTQAWRRLG